MKVLRRRGTVHGMNRTERVDALTGKEFVLWTCPICGRVEREQDGQKPTVPVEGNAPTAEDALRFARMATTPAGRLKLSHILYAYPHHDRLYIDQAGMRALATEHGIEDDGMPLVLSFT